jgi:type I restriction enzyme S subunit
MEQVLYQLPEDWKWEVLTDVTQFIGGSQPPKSEFSDTERDGYVRLIQIRDYKTDAHIVYVDKNSTKKFCNRDDVMIGRYGPPVFQILRGLEGAYNVALMKAVPDENTLSKDYLFAFLQSSPIQSYIVGLSQRAAGQSGVNKKALENYSIPIPPLTEQKRIVEKLDALLSRIDTAIEHLQESIALADGLLKSGLAKIFKGLKDSSEVVSLSSVVKINSGIALPKPFQNGFSDGEIPFFKVAQMNNHHENMVEPEITFNEKFAKEYKIKLFPKGSTLIPKRGGAILTNKKRRLLEKASYDSNIMGLKADESKISDDYLFSFMRTIDLANFVDASTIPQVNNKHIDQMQIPLIGLEEQAEVVSRVNLLVKKVEVMHSEIQSQLNNLLALKNSILDSAFKGKF